MPVSEQTYKQVALEDPEGHWELVCGRLRGKPEMAVEHNNAQERLDWALKRQLNPELFAVRQSNGKLRVRGGSYYEPDVFVIPREMVRELRRIPGTFEVYDAPALLVVEIWSPSTGAHDLADKLPEYQARGDHEIWFIHPYDRTLKAWRHRPDGSYEETLYTEGAVRPNSLPGVEIDLDALFD